MPTNLHEEEWTRLCSGVSCDGRWTKLDIKRNQNRLYPTMNQLATEARIDVTDPVYGKPLGQVSLRPLLLTKLESMIANNSIQGRKERTEYARQLAFGK